MNIKDLSTEDATCWECKKNIPLCLFSPNLNNKSGFSRKCDSCKRLISERKKSANKIYRDRKRDHFNAIRREKYAHSKDRILAQNAEYRDRNSETIKESRRLARQRDKELINEKNKIYNKKKRLDDPMFRLKDYARSRIAKVLRGKSKSRKSEEILGCSFDFLYKHLEAKFLYGMTWDNYGDWHVDHIVPLASANSLEDIERLCHYTNLQPLWAVDNIRKGAKV